MQNELHKSIYREFVYCDPSDHLMKTDNKLTRPKHNCKRCIMKNNSVQPIFSDITGHYVTNKVIQNITNTSYVDPPREEKNKTHTIIYDEDTFNQIELRGFITKDLLKQSLERESNLFHIAEDVFDELCDKYHQFKEILHTLTTEFDNSVDCIIETGKELNKKISHIIYELYLAVVNRIY